MFECRKGTLSVAVSLALAAPAALATSLLHQPVASAEAGRSIPITVTLPGSAPGEAAVVVYYRAIGDNQVNSVALSCDGGDVYAGTIPAATATDLSLRYWLEAKGPGYELALGSAEAPIPIEILDTIPAQGGSVATRMAFLTAILGVAFVAARARKYARRGRLLEELFWIRHTYHLYQRHAAGDTHGVANELRRLARTPLEHPIRGLTMYPASTIRRRFDQMSQINWSRLDHERGRLLAAGHPYRNMALPPRPPAARTDPGPGTVAASTGDGPNHTRDFGD